ncbi:exopolyphosphatase [Neorhizobium sp. AL 9.2.2]|uniref:Ppx/GppA phosphatase family protein n=1 Tax=unclassified Neorhizobium TaxID=2629175 RepID=UPI0015749ABA|nr:exopolyphosphatase [Neorhizobium sp. AL 9.2.2]
MMNPDSGGKPPEGGASAELRRDVKNSRRRKAKRNGKDRDAASMAHASPAEKAGQAGRSHGMKPDGGTSDGGRPEPGSPHPRKRKRRRSRSRSAVTENSAHAPNPSAESGDRPIGADASAGEGLRGDAKPVGKQPRQQGPQQDRNQSRKKKRAGRGPQGRPLTQAKQGPLVTAKTVSAAGHAGYAALGHESHGSPGADKFAGFRDELYAALDLGTNNCRLLIAQPTRPGQFRVIDAFSRIVRLGEGLAASGRLSTEAMDRAVDALRVCASKLAHRPIRRMRLIATEACRAAENGEAFLARVTEETGLELEIIDRETEARLAVSGCSSLVGREARSVVLFDIGGGSSEIAVIRIGDSRSSRLANHITHWTSLPVGVVTLSERHGGRDVTPAVFAGMVDEVEGMLSKFDCPPIGSPHQQGAEDFHLIGTSGTVTTLAGVHLDLPRYDRRKVDGLWLSDSEVSAMQAKLLSWDFAGRAANACIGPDRADLVLAGCAILEAIRRRWPSQRMRVADRGLREGLLTDMMADDGVWRRGRGRRFGQGSGNGSGQGHHQTNNSGHGQTQETGRKQ